MFLGKEAIVKQRFHKQYRHPVLDGRLISQRMRQEVRSMLRSRKLGVPTPVLYLVDQCTNCIYMEKVQGQSLKTVLQRHNSSCPEAVMLDLVHSLGVLVARLHDGGMVHGDLTTSNALVRDVSKESVGDSNIQRLVLIDFGLSYFSTLPEDRAVDLYVLERAFTSAHAAAGEALFEELLDAYRHVSRNWSSTFNKLSEGKAPRDFTKRKGFF